MFSKLLFQIMIVFWGFTPRNKLILCYTVRTASNFRVTGFVAVDAEEGR
jgi:hypothetical protein